MLRVFIDEAGDLGWILDKPYRRGGSSRFLTLCFLLTPDALAKHPVRLVKRFKQKHRIPRGEELKGKDLTGSQLEEFASKVGGLVQAHDQLKLLAITVQKDNVQPHTREDPNKLYNYMIRLCLLDHLRGQTEAAIIPDPRSIKVASGNSMVDYLQTTLWFDLSSQTRLFHYPVESGKSNNLQLVDVVSHVVWSHHEDRQSTAYKLLAPHMVCKHLFFA